MNGITQHIINWLTELEEHEAVDFLSNCEIEYSYVDTLFGIGDNDREIELNDAFIYVPLKISKTLSQFSAITTKIEEAIRESADAVSDHIRNIEWKPRLRSDNELHNVNSAETITKLLTQTYVSKQVSLMNQSIDDNPHLAIGAAKELIETCCKAILSEKGVIYERDWDIQKLVKETNKVIDFTAFEIENEDIVKTSVAKILGGFSNIVHGISELRNSYGSGHGQHPNFKMLDKVFVKLAVSASSDLAIFYLTFHQAKNETDDNK